MDHTPFPTTLLVYAHYVNILLLCILPLYLINYICNISKFIIPSPTTDFNSIHLGQLFMSNIIFTVGMCSVVVIDDGSSFKSVFMSMCTSLDITYWCLYRGKHKGNSVDRCHQFINKIQATAGNDRGTHEVYL